ncbi:MAG TPA: hypothetical protein VHL09_17360 [Dehalococcoidia bacterium]|nr:hypothetical protein [Dehalococcoidia bacterium]
MGTIDLGDPAEARLVAELLLAGSLGVDRAGLYARFGEPVPEPAAART